MNEVLMSLQPRSIPDAIASLNTLEIDKVWFRGYTEVEVCKHLNQFIEGTDYDYYWIIADDVIVDSTPMEVLRPALHEGKVVTGYCKWYDESEFVNLLHTPLTCTYYQEHPNWNFIQRCHKANPKRFQWVENISSTKPDSNEAVNNCLFDVIPQLCAYTFTEVQKKQDTSIVTHFGGWSFTGASREIWLKYPFQCSIQDCESDMQFAARYVNRDGNKIYSHYEAYFVHLKTTSDILTDNWLVGNEAPITYVGQGLGERSDIADESILHDGADTFVPSKNYDILSGHNIVSGI